MSKAVEIFPAFKEFLQPARFKVAYGGRGSAKTRTFITLLVDNCLYYGWRIVCFREIMKSIEDSVYQEIISEIDRRNLNEHFDPLKKEIKCLTSGGVFKFDGLYRNSSKVKGYSNFDCAFVEEAANVTESSWNMLIPTLRKPGSEIWVAFNPESPLDNTYKRFVSERIYPDYLDGERYCVVKKINYVDNPRLPKELVQDMELMKAADYDLYTHVYEGEPVANSDLSVIPPKWFLAAIDLHKYLDQKPVGGKTLGFDVADEGPDFNAVALLHGWVVTKLAEWKDNDPNSAANEAWDIAIANGAERIVFDAIGVGAGAKGELRGRVAEAENASRVPPVIDAWIANSGVVEPNMPYAPGYHAESVSYERGKDKTNAETFANLKAQAYWDLRDRCYNAFKARNGKPYDSAKLISFDSELIDAKALDKLKGEASQPRREYINGRFTVESKKKMKARGVNSPNLLDAVVMAISPTEQASLVDLMF